MEKRRVVGFMIIAALVLMLAVGWTLAAILLFPEQPQQKVFKAACGNGIVENAESEETCCHDTGCPPDKKCSGNSCIALECGYCEYAANNTCNKYECCSSNDCKKTEACANHKCSVIECECGYIQNNTCVPYECCNGFECASGVCQSNRCVSEESLQQQPVAGRVSSGGGSSGGSGKAEVLAAQTQPQQEQQAQQECGSGQVRGCGTEVGECSSGTRSCSNGQWGSCQGGISAVPEVCDGKDNDCDGSIDEGSLCEGQDVNVLVLSYFPLDSSGASLDQGITGYASQLSSVREKVDGLTDDVADALTSGSAYHRYKDASAEPALRYKVVDAIEYLKKEPVSGNAIPWNAQAFRPDYRLMLEDDVEVCDYVDNQGVKEVWVWGYHYGPIEPVESDMAMGTISRQHWNHGSFGDVSNSEQIDDLPTCERTYTLYNYNYGRGLGEALENHGHHLEAVFAFVDAGLWDKFKGPHGKTNQVNSCGWTHSPPNTEAEYDWGNPASVLSNCEDWKPDGSGQAKAVSCHTWYGETCLDNGGVEFKVWWMQNIPGMNNGITYNGKLLKNWWAYIGDFDAAVNGGGLY